MGARCRAVKVGKYFAFVPRGCSLIDDIENILRSAPNADFVYGDSFHFSKLRDSAFVHQARPPWSPERLRGHCYVGEVVFATESLVNRAGGVDFLRSISEHDRALRLSELAEQPTHVSALVYRSPIKQHFPSADVQAVQSHCDRVGIAAHCSLSASGNAVRVQRDVAGTPKIAVIIPTRGTRADVRGEEVVLVAHAISSLCNKTTYKNLEFIVVADTSTPEDAIAAIQNSTTHSLKIIPYDKPFNFAEKINIGAVSTDAEYLLLMNDDVEVISEDILESLLGHLADSTVGMAGPLLVYEDGVVQSGGHMCNPVPFDMYRTEQYSATVGFGILSAAREVSGVIAAFSLIPRAVFEEAGGLCMEFPSDYNDVDFSMKLHSLGYRTIFTPFVSCIHFESKTRIAEFDAVAIARLGKRWQHLVENDPYRNPYVMRGASIWITNDPTTSTAN